MFFARVHETRLLASLVDVYRGDPGAKSLSEFALYVSYFPHLIAGPIMRATELLPQLRAPKRFDSARVSEGMFVMLTGFVKKMVIADNLAPLNARLLYVQCPQAPFIDTNDANVCGGL